MAKLIHTHFGKIISIEPIHPSEADEKWSWRKSFVGFIGMIHIYQSCRKHKGKNYIVMCDAQLNCLKTGAGDVTYEGDTLTVTTTNSKYTFQLMDNKESKVNEWQKEDRQATD